MTEHIKTCVRCEGAKPITEFYKQAKSRDGFQNQCKVCTKAASKAWRAANPDYRSPSYRSGRRPSPESRFASRLKYLYGITVNEYEEMLNAQRGKCAICEDEMQPPHVDHCHSSGRVRALLCNSCNVGIGLLKEDPKRLLAAARYVETHS